MLDPDISTADALRLLSVPAQEGGPGDAPGPYGWTRRGFLQAIGLGVVGGAALGSLGEHLLPGGEVHQAFAGAPIGPGDGILVPIMFYGGNDGLNTVIPYADGKYYTVRPRIAIPADQVLKLDGQVGLHPNLTFLKALYDAGQVAVVQGVGYANPDLSHFNSMAIWMHGRHGGGAPTSGWLGRWLDGQPAHLAELAAATISTSVPLHMLGQVRRAVGISEDGSMFGTEHEPYDLRMYDGLRAMAAPAGRGPWHDLYSSSLRTQLDLADDVAPVFAAGLPGGEIERKLTVAARLINANIGLRVVDVGFGSFDTHDGQGWRHGDLLRQLDAGLAAFYATLLPQFRDQVTLMTMSEFGRTSYGNDSSGTDHGTAAPHFVIGTRVRGGLYGQAPSLANLNQFDRLQHTVDFRSVYGTVLDGWLGGGASTILGGGYESLGLFAGGPAAGSGTPFVLPPASPSGFVGLTPRRVFDTRDGTGGRAAPLGPGESFSFGLAGQFDIPATAVAVAMNLTSVDATAPSFVTVWPSGQLRPFTANLNPVPGMAVPNLVVARLGGDGAAAFFNNSGSVHLVADVVGYFDPTSNGELDPLTPARLLDTRDGTGDRLGPIGQGEWIDLQVGGRGGVRDGVEAVALNVTVTEPTAGSFVTIWPAGAERPFAASLNMVPGQTVSNMVLCRTGDGGRISVFNASGSTHVVIDALGCFSSSGAARFVPLTPSRVLDTREGIGAPTAPVAQAPLGVQLAGRGGVPTSGTTAVLLNLTAVTPTLPTFVTAYPSGVDRPLAANITIGAGKVVPNMVLARLGADGKAMIYNNTGAVDLVADVVGYWTG